MAFYDCKQLRDIQLNEGLETLGVKEKIETEQYEGNVFQESGLRSITLPRTLKEMGNRTLLCNNLKTVYFEDNCALEIR